MASKFRFRRSFGNVSSRFRGAIPKHFPLFTGLLDDFGGAAAAWSLKALSRDWLSQPVINARRGGDDVTADFKESELSDGTIVAWASAGSGDSNAYVTNIYDQSGNSSDATNATPAEQRKIVDTGVLVTDGGEPAIAGGLYGYDLPSVTVLTDDFSILSLAGLGSGSVIAGKGLSDRPYIRSSSSATFQARDNGGVVASFTGINNSPTSHTFDGSKVLIGVYRDVSDDVTITVAGQEPSTSPINLVNKFSFDRIMARDSDQNPLSGVFQELIMWDRDIR